MRVTFNAPVVLSFALLSTIAFLILQYTGLGRSFFVLGPSFNVTSFSWYISLFGYTLGHASWEHLIGNLSFILLLGPILEEKYGSQKLLIMLILTALITAFCHIIFFSHSLLGASGVVFMFIILVSLANVKSGEIPLSFILIVILFLGKEIMASFNDDQISQFGHIFGGILGSVFGFTMSGNSGGKTKTTSNKSNGDRLKDTLNL